MSSPFGGHPTLAIYLGWLKTEHNLSTLAGLVKTSTGQKPYTRVEKKGGGYLNLFDRTHGDYLEPEYVEYLDRKIGVVSTWGLPKP